jgi:hypothetical protein
VTVILGDCLEVMRGMEGNSVSAVVTDPPAGISFMNADWDHHKGGRAQWIAWMTEVMQEVARVCRPGAHMLCWALPRTSHWTATAIEDAGWEIRDVVTHLFGSGFPKSMDVGKAIDKAAGVERDVVGVKSYAYPDTDRPSRGASSDGSVGMFGQEFLGSLQPVTAPATDAARQWDGWGTNLKPGAEMWILARKPLSEPTVAANVLKWSTGALNIDQSRIKPDGANGGAGGHVHASPLSVRDAVQRIVAVLQSYSTSDTSRVRAEGDQDDMSPLGAGYGETLMRRLYPNGSWCGLRLSEALGSPACCLPCRDLYDERLRDVQEAAQVSPLALADALAGMSLALSEPSRSRDCLSTDRLCTAGVEAHISALVSLLSQSIIPYSAPQGRWPANAIFSHVEGPDGCEEVGARKVKGSNAAGASTPRKWGMSTDIRGVRSTVAHRDADGMETVSAWRCVESCPVLELDRQSGVRRSAGQYPTTYSNTGGYGGQIGRDIQGPLYADTGTASRFFFVAKPSRAERERGLAAMARQRVNDGRDTPGVFGGETLEGAAARGRQPRHEAGTEPRANTHPTVKSTALMRHLLTLVVPPGGIVLDPFAGSGSTGVAAAELGMEFIGIEKEPAYHAIALARIEDAELRMEAERVLPLFAHAGIEL